jgi:hypothetical protein
METKGMTENNIEQNTSTISEPMDEVSLSLFLQYLIVYLFFKSNGDPQQDKDEDGDEPKRNLTKKKRKEIDLPITSRVPGATKIELDRLIEQEVTELSNENKLKSLFLIE